MDNSPIGIFDSGMGGLSVWARIRAAMPSESLLYYADAANCPYGDRGHEEIRGYVEEAVGQMLGIGVKMVVVACNTATAAAIKYLREKYRDMLFVGMEPAVKPAALGTKTGVIGVLATRSSLDGGHFRRTSSEFADKVRILTAVGEGWVGIVEEGCEGSPEALDAVRKIVEPMLENEADRLVMGCTHYPFLAGVIRQVVGEREVQIIDSAPAIAKRVGELLEQNDATAAPDNIAEYAFMTSAGEDYLKRLRRKAQVAADMAF